MTDLASIPAEDLFREYMSRFGVDVTGEHFKDTPKRVTRMYTEMLSGYKPPKFKFTTFKAGDKPSLVTVAGIPYHSFCSHHVAVFSGIAHVAYLPDKRLCGLSKLARAVRHFAARLQVQETLTDQITDFLQDKLQPKAVGVILQAEHQCMSLRGVRVHGSLTTTSAMRGLFIEDAGLKEEFFKVVDWSNKK